MEEQYTGLLLNPNNIKLHRKYFEQMTSMIGIQVLYRPPREGKTYNMYGELDTFYYEPMKVGCIFDEHPTIWTQKKLGWNTELNENSSIISVPYDLPNLQVGAIFIIRCGVDNSQGRVFRVIRMSTISIYPASVSCEIAPLMVNTSSPSLLDHKNDNGSLLADNGDED